MARHIVAPLAAMQGVGARDVIRKETKDGLERRGVEGENIGSDWYKKQQSEGEGVIEEGEGHTCKRWAGKYGREKGDHAGGGMRC